MVFSHTGWNNPPPPVSKVCHVDYFKAISFSLRKKTKIVGLPPPPPRMVKDHTFFVFSDEGFPKSSFEIINV